MKPSTLKILGTVAVAIVISVFIYAYIKASDNYYGVESKLGDGRVYNVIAPENIDEVAGSPLLIPLHGSGGSMKDFADETKLGDLGFEEGFITVFG